MRSRAGSASLAAPDQPVWPATFSDGLPLPKLVAFDLDYTLWPCWADTHVTPPLAPHDGGLLVKDRYDEAFGFYPDVAAVLDALRQKGAKTAAASRTHSPDVARDMLRLLRVPRTAPAPRPTLAAALHHRDAASARALDLFDHLQIYPGSKTTHFARIKRDSGIDFDDMLFFDDEPRNKNVEVLGVVAWIVRDGLTRDEVDDGVRSWRKRAQRLDG